VEIPSDDSVIPPSGMSQACPEQVGVQLCQTIFQPVPVRLK
jgi:hypothetical protein